MTPPLDRRACLEGSVSEGQPSIGDELTAVHQAHVGAHVVVGHTKLSTRNALADLARGRSRFTTDEWTLLFSPEQYVASAEAYLRGVERRVHAGLDPAVDSVGSVFVSRWDTAVADRVPDDLRDRLGIAEAALAYRACRELLDSPRWGRLANEGARAQRLLWASTSTKNPDAPDVLYVNALAAPFTINTMPEATLHAYADHGQVSTLMAADGGDAEQTLTAFERAGIDHRALADQLQRDGAATFDKSWRSLLTSIASKRQQLSATGS